MGSSARRLRCQSSSAWFIPPRGEACQLARARWRKEFQLSAHRAGPSSRWQIKREASNDTNTEDARRTRQGGIKYDFQTPSWAPAGHFTLFPPLLQLHPPPERKKSEKKEEKSAREATTNRNHIFRLPPVLGLLVCQDYTCIHGGIGMEFIS